MTSVAKIIVAAAHLLLPVREAGNNRGRFVEAIIRFAGGVPGEPWCASFVYYVGRKMLGEAWPLPKTRSCDILLEHARKAQVLRDDPQVGRLFLVMKNDHDATHVGFVSELLPGGRFTTVEGNSNDRGVRDGDGVVSNVRDPSGPTRYQFVDWAALVFPNSHD